MIFSGHFYIEYVSKVNVLCTTALGLSFDCNQQTHGCRTWCQLIDVWRALKGLKKIVRHIFHWKRCCGGLTPGVNVNGRLTLFSATTASSENSWHTMLPQLFLLTVAYPCHLPIFASILVELHSGDSTWEILTNTSSWLWHFNKNCVFCFNYTCLFFNGGGQAVFCA